MSPASDRRAQGSACCCLLIVLHPLAFYGPMALLLLMKTASPLVFNRQDGLGSTALYFVGSYTLGMLAFWTSNRLRNGRDAATEPALVNFSLAAAVATCR